MTFRKNFHNNHKKGGSFIKKIRSTRERLRLLREKQSRSLEADYNSEKDAIIERLKDSTEKQRRRKRQDLMSKGRKKEPLTPKEKIKKDLSRLKKREKELKKNMSEVMGKLVEIEVRRQGFKDAMRIEKLEEENNLLCQKNSALLRELNIESEMRIVLENDAGDFVNLVRDFLLAKEMTEEEFPDREQFLKICLLRFGAEIPSDIGEGYETRQEMLDSFAEAMETHAHLLTQDKQNTERLTSYRLEAQNLASINQYIDEFFQGFLLSNLEHTPNSAYLTRVFNEFQEYVVVVMQTIADLRSPAGVVSENSPHVEFNPTRSSNIASKPPKTMSW